VGNKGLGKLRGDGQEASTARAWLPWKSLLPALAVSLLAHGLLLFAFNVRRDAHAPAPVLLVTLRTVTVVPPPPPPAPAPAAATPAPVPPPQPTPRVVAPAPVPVPAPVPPQAAPAPAAPAPDREFHPVDELTQAPLPQGTPDVQEVAARLVGRRLPVTVWVDADGMVDKAVVTRNELTPEVATLLEEAIAKVRFTPARRDAQPAAAIVRTLLCFDDAGVLDTTSDECWKPQPTAGR
jgi:hypothetical protein